MRYPPTDFQILNEIYRRYYPTFASFSREEQTRSAKVLVPIDIKSIAQHFGVDGDIVFGRLYYHPNPKYSYTQADGLHVTFFRQQVGSDRHCVQFPLLDAVLAKLREERTRELRTTWLSIVAIAISFISLIVSVVRIRH